MKSNPLLIATLALGLTGSAWLKADDTDTSTPPAPPPPDSPTEGEGGGHHHWGGPQLTDDEKAKLKAAYTSAISSNPDLKTQLDQAHAQMKAAMDAMKAANDKLHAAMVAADPTVEPLLAKFHGHHGPPPGAPTDAPPSGSAESSGSGGNQ
jgi:Spy/CpxP family protein refolding chaperone